MSDTDQTTDQSPIDGLEQRMTALEEENQELKAALKSRKQGVSVVTRRQTLGLLGGSTLLGMAGTASAQSSSGDDGPPFADEGHNHSGDYLGEETPVDRIDANNAHAGDVYNMQGESAAIQTAWDGLVVPIAPGLGASDAIDPNKTETPVQDALDAVANAGSSPASQGGRVILPSEPIEEKTTIDLKNGVHLIGQGIGYYNRTPPFGERDEADRTPERVSKIRVLEKGVDLLRIESDERAMQYIRLDGFIIEGPRGKNPSDGATETGKGLHITAGTRLTRGTIGTIQFQNLSDSAIYAEADLVECNFGMVLAGGIDAANHGNAVYDFRNTGYSNHIDLLSTYPKNRSSGKGSDALRITGQGDLSINVLNFGGTLARAVVIGGSSDGWVTIGGLNYEPGPQNQPQVVIEKAGSRGFEMGPAIIRTADDPPIERYCLLRNSANSYIGPYRINKGSSMQNDHGIAIEGNPGGTNVVYQPSSDVVNLSPFELTPPVACLGDLTSFSEAGDGNISAYSVPNKPLTVDGNLGEVSNLSGLTLSENFSTFSGTYTSGGTIWWTWDQDHLYLVGDLEDDEHVQDEPSGKTWRDDVIQAGVSSGVPSEADAWDELDMALGPDGPLVYHRVLPSSSNPGELESAATAVVREDGHTRYEVGLPWDVLTASPSDEYVSLALAVHDTDSGGNTGWVEWGGGILGGKDNALFNLSSLVDSSG